MRRARARWKPAVVLLAVAVYGFTAPWFNHIAWSAPDTPAGDGLRGLSAVYLTVGMAIIVSLMVTSLAELTS